MKNAIKQLSIFLENKKGELTDITNILSTNKISIKALNLVDGSEFGILRLLVDDLESAKRIMDDNGFSSTTTEVFAVLIDDHIGSFNEVLTVLTENNINVDYTYTINSSNSGAFIFKVSVDDFEKATKVLAKSKVKLLKNV
ncbi:amino acid-binding protein [Halarcobacter sp.]|uniref:amino acid-binding protein n=1 Tax=Halarcobacter sp. TaxID=2321133 RepID=UPI002AA82F3D|nr:amino acid-binding protein [Halarcobacter sp.]